MSIDSINRPPISQAGSQQSTETAKAGTHGDRVVSTSTEQNVDGFSSLSSSIPQSSLRDRDVRRATSGEHRGLFSTLRLRFGGQRQPKRMEISSPKKVEISSPESVAADREEATALIKRQH